MAVFLMENGVLSMGNKTPVTILQEILHRKGLNPHYELIYNGVGTMDPIFKYQVSALGFIAIGDGKSKKEAKHDAAASILKRMQVGSNSPEIQEMDIASPYTGAIKQNFVGMLDEICVFNKIPFPVFVPISEYGPPHARIFTMQCKISSCTETAVARTKKQAKHMVAQQMINRISDIMEDKFIPISEKNPEGDEHQAVASNLNAIQNGNYRHDFSIPISEFQNIFYYKMDEFLVPQKFFDLHLEPEEFYERLENPKEFLDDILQGLEGLSNSEIISKHGLSEAFQEIEKDCQTFVWAQNAWNDGSEELNYSSDDNDCDDKYLCCESRVLEEFDLQDTDNKLCSNKVIEENAAYSLVEEEELENCKPKQEKYLNVSSVMHLFLFLSIECPQGKWTFRGAGETLVQAEKTAAIQALKFLRIMSIPTTAKNADNDL